MISGTLQISSVRSPFWRSVPLTESQILPLAGWPIFEAGCSAQQGAEWSNDLPISHGRSFLREAMLQVAAGQVDADGVAVDVVERLVGGNVEAAALHRHDQFDLVMQILGQRRVGDGGAVGYQHVGVLGEEERRRALVIAHLADVLEIIAPDAPDAANRKGLGFAGDGKRGLRRSGNDKGCGVHEGVSAGLRTERRMASFTRLR